VQVFYPGIFQDLLDILEQFILSRCIFQFLVDILEQFKYETKNKKVAVGGPWRFG